MTQRECVSDCMSKRLSKPIKRINAYKCTYKQLSAVAMRFYVCVCIFYDIIYACACVCACLSNPRTQLKLPYNRLINEL